MYFSVIFSSAFASFSGILKAYRLFISEKTICRIASSTVRLSFTIEKDGSIANIFVVNSVGGGCDNEAIRLMQETVWLPAERHGKYVRSRNMQDITFNIGSRNFQDGNS